MLDGGPHGRHFGRHDHRERREVARGRQAVMLSDMRFHPWVLPFSSGRTVMANQLGMAEQQSILVFARHGWSQRRTARTSVIHRDTVARCSHLGEAGGDPPLVYVPAVVGVGTRSGSPCPATRVCHAAASLITRMASTPCTACHQTPQARRGCRPVTRCDPG